MRKIESFAHQLFPVMAISGLLLAGWALIATPDSVRMTNDANDAASAALNAPAQQDGIISQSVD